MRRAYARDWQRRNQREANLRNKYNLTLDQFDSMAEAQDHLCAICGVQPDLLHVDHEHTTGTVRGLICGSCNRGLGMFKDNKTDSLYGAIQYLNRANPQTFQHGAGI